MKYPKVSIIIPVYNGSNYLREAIDSALAQTYKNIEILVVNDGSTDRGKTERIAKSYGRKIRYFKKPNGGVATALNLGIKKMTGVYFSWLSHDDLYFPNKIEAQINFIKEKHLSDQTILYSDFALIDSKGRQYLTTSLKPIETGVIGALIINSFVNGCSLLVPKLAFQKAGNFDKKWWTTQDYQLWFRFIKAGFNFKKSPGVLVKSRQHPGQDSVTLKDPHQKEKEELYLWTLNNFTPRQIFGWHKNYLTSYLELSAALRFLGYPTAARLAQETGMKNCGLERYLYVIKYRYLIPFIKRCFGLWPIGINFIRKRLAKLIR